MKHVGCDFIILQISYSEGRRKNTFFETFLARPTGIFKVS